MTTGEHSTVIAIFADRDRANQAIDDLRRAGFGYNQIRLVERGTGGFLDSIKSAFTGQEITSTSRPDDLMKLGVQEQSAHYYQSQLDAGQAIVIVSAGSHLELALNFLRQSGAYDISARLSTDQASVPAGTPQPAAAGSYNPNAPQQGTYNSNVPPGPYNPNAPQQGTYNQNVPSGGSYNPNAPQQGTYNQNVPSGPSNPNVPQQGTYNQNVPSEPPR